MNSFDLSGKSAVVTGGGQGIGEGIAKNLAAAGASVIVAARHVDRIARVADEINAAGGTAVPPTAHGHIARAGRSPRLASSRSTSASQWVSDIGMALRRASGFRGGGRSSSAGIVAPGSSTGTTRAPEASAA